MRGGVYLDNLAEKSSFAQTTSYGDMQYLCIQ
jgi:hypothetical protein